MIFDMRLESEHNAGFIYGAIRDNEPDWAPFLSSKISFEFAKSNPRIQVADLLAREAMKALDNLIGPVNRPTRKSWQALLDTKRFVTFGFGTDWFESLKHAMPEAEKKMNMNREMYIEWLSERKRQHNLSNMFQFADWTAKRDSKKH
jgi:hypothetical protein